MENRTAHTGKTSASLPPPKMDVGWLYRIKQNFLSPWYNTLLTLFACLLIYAIVAPLYTWGIKNASFGATPESCEGIQGACWGVIRDMWPVFMVGTYPSDQRWRALAALLLIVILVIASLFRRLRQKKLIYLLWALSPIVIFFLIRGGSVSGLPYVESSRWGGLMLTVMLSAVGMTCAFPISLLLALGRRSRMLVVKAFCVAYIELIRGVPLISILFMASVVLPLFFPSEMEFDKVLRAQIGITMFFSAYLAENIRGGLQGIPRGQEEAAAALGLSYWQRMGLIMLPQALRIVIPPMVNSFIGIMKDTSLVGIIGLVDLLQAAFAVTANPRWLGRIEEAYIFVALFYWILCYSLSRYSRHLEEKFQVDHR